MPEGKEDSLTPEEVEELEELRLELEEVDQRRSELVERIAVLESKEGGIKSLWNAAQSSFSLNAFNMDAYLYNLAAFEARVNERIKQFHSNTTFARDPSKLLEDVDGLKIAAVLKLASETWGSRNDDITIPSHYRERFESFMNTYRPGQYELIWDEKGGTRPEKHESARSAGALSEIIIGVRSPGLMRDGQVLMRERAAVN